MPIDKLPFVGMGGFRFVDFLLANRILGVKKFTSIEHDENIIERCNFNKPFSALTVFSGTSSEYVATVGFPLPAIVWFDYESGVSPALRDDMLEVSGAIRPGSFLFITATAELPLRIKNIKRTKERAKFLASEIYPFGSELSESDMTPSTFHMPAARILRSALTFGFSGRTDGVFYPYLRLTYKDTTWMMTVGGYFGTKKDVADVRRIVRDRCGFLRPDSSEFVYEVEQFNITDAERRLLDRMAISAKARRSERLLLNKLGLRQSIIDQYPDLMRFIPRYFESLI